MAEISQPGVISPDDVATSLHSEFTELASTPADLDPVAEFVSLDIAMASSPSLTSTQVPPVCNTSIAASDGTGIPSLQLATTASVAVTSGSPAAHAASCASTPPTPLSHGSDSSPGLHSDVPVTIPPPPYSAQGLTTDLVGTAAVPVESLVQPDASRSHLPPPPKKPLTPYMRFSKSVSDDIAVVIARSSIKQLCTVEKSSLLERYFTKLNR